MAPSNHFEKVTALADPAIGGSADPSIALRRIAAQLSGHVVLGLLNGISIDRLAIVPHPDGGWIGSLEWRPPLQVGDHKVIPRRLRRRANQKLLHAYLAGRAAQLLDSFGWPGDTFSLGYAAPETECVLDLAELVSPSDPWRVIHGGIKHVGEFIQDPVVTGAITVFAEALAVERDMSGCKATWVVTEALRAANEAALGS